jgi:hypothetical protein
MHYGPDEVEFFLIDFKKGVEFKTYATHGLPHARVVAVESDREFGVSALERLDGILQERGELFRAEGVQDIAQYRDAHPDRALPRILLIVDEFQEFFVQDDSHAQTATLLLDRLVRQGRAFGVHVLLGSQTLGGAYSLARTTLSQMAVRIALQTSDADAHLILSEENTAARLLTRPGEAIYNDANGMLAGNSLFQVAWLADEEHDDALERVRSLADARGLPPARPVVFEGNVPADPARNAELSERIERAASGEPVDDKTRLWIGEPVSISGPTSLTLERQSGGNLILVGADEPAATGILAASLISLGTVPGENVEPDHPRLVVLVGGHDEQAWSDVMEALPVAGRVVRPNGSAEAVRELAAEVRRRADSAEPAPPIALVVHDLGKFRELRRDEDDYGFGGFDRDKPQTAAQALAEVLKDGPAVGVHALVWANSYNTVERWLGRPLLREFEKRIAFAMSAADSSSLIDAPDAGRLGPYRALLYHDDRGGIEKFRPYGPPSPRWLGEVRDRVQGRPALADIEFADDINEWTII